jgi:predicted porin
LATGGGNTTLGRIGTGYLYADWKAQISYLSPNWSGFSANVGIFSPWGLARNPVGQPPDGLSLDSVQFDQEADTPRFEGKLDYSWEGDFNGKVWIGGLYQNLKTNDPGFSDVDSWGFDIGAKVGFGNFEAVGYWYTGEALGTTGYLWDAVAPNGNERDSDGGYVQGTYKIPGLGTKLGLNWGISNLDRASGEARSSLVEENKSWTAGVYHPLTEALTLTAEYTATRSKAHNGDEAKENTFAIGAILFY